MPSPAANDRARARTPTPEPAVPVQEPPPLPPIVADAGSRERVSLLTQTREVAAGCRACPLYAMATQTVFGEGPVDAPLMFVGEQPGDQEDLRGHPFVGPAGKLFERALAELSLSREQVYITNAVKHFKYEPRGPRRMHKTPAQREADACLRWLEREIALVRAPNIVALGATAARSLLGRAVPVLRERGHWLVREDGRRVLITLHPSALLRVREDREQAYRRWLEDLAVAARVMRA